MKIKWHTPNPDATGPYRNYGLDIGKLGLSLSIGGEVGFLIDPSLTWVRGYGPYLFIQVWNWTFGVDWGYAV